MPPPPMAVQSSLPSLGAACSSCMKPPEGPPSAPCPISDATSSTLSGQRTQHAVEVRVAEAAGRVERRPHRLEVVPARVAGGQGLVALEVHLSPMWPPAVVVHDPLDAGEVCVVRGTSVHMHRDVGGLTAMGCAERDVVAC